MIKANHERDAPPLYRIENHGDTLRVIVTDANSVVETVDSEGQPEYQYCQYEALVKSSPDTDVAEELQSNFGMWFAQIQAVDRERTATIFRRRRNDLLQKSDCEMSLDRMGLEMPSGTSFVSWLDFLRKLAGIVTGDWATYRQRLRDLPQSDKWPYLDDDDWPVAPQQEKKE